MGHLIQQSFATTDEGGYTLLDLTPVEFAAKMTDHREGLKKMFAESSALERDIQLQFERLRFE